MSLHVTLAILSAFGWAISCFLSIKSTRIKINIKNGDVARVEPFHEYTEGVGRLNSWAGAIGAASAGLAALSMFMSAM